MNSFKNSLKMKVLLIWNYFTVFIALQLNVMFFEISFITKFESNCSNILNKIIKMLSSSCSSNETFKFPIPKLCQHPNDCWIFGILILILFPSFFAIYDSWNKKIKDLIPWSAFCLSFILYQAFCCCWIPITLVNF